MVETNAVMNTEPDAASTTGSGVITATGGPLAAFKNSYDPVHGYLSVVVCSIGLVFNLINIYVLTRRRMRGTPTNTLLTALSVSDAATCAVYLPFSAIFYIDTEINEGRGHSRDLARFAISATNLVILFHSAAMWFTVALAAFRYALVRHLPSMTGGPSHVKTTATVLAVFLLSILTTLPAFLCFSVTEVPEGSMENNITIETNTSDMASGTYTRSLEGFLVEFGTSGGISQTERGSDSETVSRAYTDSGVHTSRQLEKAVEIGMTEVCTAHDQLLLKLTFLVVGGLVRTGACLSLVVLSCLLLRSLSKAKAHHDKVHVRSITPTSAATRPTTPALTTTPLISAPPSPNPPATPNTPQSPELNDANPLSNCHPLDTSPQSIAESKESTPLTPNTPATTSMTTRISGSVTTPKVKVKISGGGHQSKRRRHMDTVTRMLVAVVLMFVVIDLPQGLLVVASFSNDWLFENVYLNLGDFLDLLVLVNSSVNFLFYATMSRQYRRTFEEVWEKVVPRWCREGKLWRMRWGQRSQRGHREVDESLTIPLRNRGSILTTTTTMVMRRPTGNEWEVESEG